MDEYEGSSMEGSRDLPVVAALASLVEGEFEIRYSRSCNL